MRGGGAPVTSVSNISYVTKREKPAVYFLIHIPMQGRGTYSRTSIIHVCVCEGCALFLIRSFYFHR